MRALTAREPLAAAGQRGALQQRRQHSRPLRCVTVAQAKAEGDSSQKKGAHLFVARRFGITVDADGGGPGRTIFDYVRLPAESYNVLDSKAVKRLDEKSFRVSTGMQKMLLFTAEPTGVIEIEVLPNGVTQRLRDAELLPPAEKPHKMIAELNRTLSGLQLTNSITAAPGENGETLLQCQLELDGRFTEGPFSKVPEDRLNGLMAWALGMAMPWFLTKLRQDYVLWSEGKDRRQATGKGEMNNLAKELAAGGRGKLPKGVVELPVVLAGNGEEGRGKQQLGVTADAASS